MAVSHERGTPVARGAASQQPSQFEQIVDLKISDLPCGTLKKKQCATRQIRDLEIDYLLEV